jgi:hypothetical protein
MYYLEQKRVSKITLCSLRRDDHIATSRFYAVLSKVHKMKSQSGVRVLSSGHMFFLGSRWIYLDINSGQLKIMMSDDMLIHLVGVYSGTKLHSLAPQKLIILIFTPWKSQMMMIILNTKLKRCDNKSSWRILKEFPKILPEVLTTRTRNVRQDSWAWDPIWNRLFRYEKGVINSMRYAKAFSWNIC